MEDAGPLQASSKTLTGPAAPQEASLPQPPVMETGEAGPPGKMTSSKLPRGTDGSMMPVLGFAGAPGETHTRTLLPRMSLAIISLHLVLFHSSPSQTR